MRGKSKEEETVVFPTHIVAAAGYVFDKSGNLLMIKTPNRGWDCTGGQVEVGENLEEAVLRHKGESKMFVRCVFQRGTAGLL